MGFSFAILHRKLLATLIVAAILVLSWAALWGLTALRYYDVIDGWIATQRAAGYHVDYEARHFFGFPRRVVFRFTNLRWASPDGIALYADDMDLAAKPWQWQIFDAKFKNHVELTAPIAGINQALVLGGGKGQAHIELDQDGVWQLARVSLDMAHVGRAPDYLFQAGRLEASAARPDHPPKDHKESGLTLTGEATHMVWPPMIVSPFGQQMDRLNIRLRVMDAVPDFRKKASVEAWNKDSGVVQVDAVQMIWGPLNLSAKGTLGLDDDLQPEGAFASVIGGQKAVLKALMDHGFVAQHQDSMMDYALDLFAKPAKLDDGTNGIAVPIAVQLGGLFLGPVKIFSFPEVEWPVGP